MASKLPVAHALVERGFAVFPVAAGAKSPPLLHDWPNHAAKTAADVEALWVAVPDANVAIHCEGLCVLDVDVAKGGDQAYAILDEIHGFPHTLVTRTPTGGRHLFYRLPAGHPGVGNTVGNLGPGLDTRSTGGYAVAPGSDVPAGRYHFEADVPIAPAPEWLLALLGAATAKASHPATPVADAPADALQRASSWLANQPGAVEGQGGDAHTYATACKLRDLGVSEAQCVELLTGWNERCSPPWTPNELGIKAHNAYRYAQEGTAGKLAVTAADFPIFPIGNTEPAADSPAQVARIGNKVQRLDEFAERGRAGGGYVVKGVLQRGSYAEIYGAPSEGKTFVALDIAYHVAAGKEWHGRKVHAGPVLYLAYEGGGGMVNRAKALRKHYGTGIVPLYIADASMNLREQEGRKALGEILASLPAKPVLICVDTFARALMGGDENSAQDVGAFNSAVAALIESTGACVMIVHHSGKNKAVGARGSSALLGAIDTEIEIDAHRITPTKQRDVELGEPIGFQLLPLAVAMDEDGDLVTSCVVEPAAVEPAMPRLKGNAKSGFDMLCRMSPDNAPVHVDRWKEACKDFLGSKGFTQRFYEIKVALLDKGFITCDHENKVRRRLD